MQNPFMCFFFVFIHLFFSLFSFPWLFVRSLTTKITLIFLFFVSSVNASILALISHTEILKIESICMDIIEILLDVVRYVCSMSFFRLYTVDCVLFMGFLWKWSVDLIRRGVGWGGKLKKRVFGLLDVTFSLRTANILDGRF